MKRLITLLVAGCMVLGALGTAAAVDLKVSGQWQIHYGYYSHNTLRKASDAKQDRLRFRQRFRTQFRFIADENLQGMLNFEIGDMNYGNNRVDDSGGRNGGGLEADGYNIKVKWAYIDWTIPQTQIKTRLGIQPMGLPSVTFGNPVWDGDAAGITLSYQVTPEVGLTAFWSRPYDDGWSTERDGAYGRGYDEMDLFGITVPIKTDVIRMTPWAMGALIGRDSYYYGEKGTSNNGVGNYWGDKTSGRYVGGRAPKYYNDMDKQGYAWWAGTTFELPVIDPFFVNLDGMVGGLYTGSKHTNAFGWFFSGDIGYKWAWGRTSIIGWYSSGDDGQGKDDRGTIPGIAEINGFKPTRYGTSGTSLRSFDDVLGTIGFGMWGLGLKIADVSFVDNLKHTLIGVYMQGTNSRSSVDRGEYWDTGYFLTSDSAWEVNLLNNYKFSENFQMNLDFAYVDVDLGSRWGNKNKTHGSFATMVGFQYSF